MNDQTSTDDSASDARPDEPGRENRLIRLARGAGVDRAVAFAILARVWQLLTGPVTQLLIVLHFSRATQDFYYAFSSLLGVQVFIELGLHVVIISVSSHEWAGLSLVNGMIEGDPVARSRLISLGRLMLKWYSIAAGLFAVLLIIAGLAFFPDTMAHRWNVPETANAEVRDRIAWIAPWITLVILNALQLVTLPLTSILEGCHQLPVLNRTRFWQGVTGTLLVWGAVSSGLGLWALSVSAAVRLTGELYLVAVPFRSFFRAFRTPSRHGRVDWKEEILPLQWRIAVQGVVLWFANQLPLLMVFRYLPEGDAARLGMTWTILTAAQAGAFAWVETRRPVFGSLIAAKRYADLDALFFRLAAISTGLLSGFCVCLVLFINLISFRSEWLFVRLSERLLPVTETSLLAAGFVANLPGMCANIYVRAHKRDPFLLAAIVSNLAVMLFQLVPGWKYGLTGIAAGYFVGIAAVQTPLLLTIWWRTRLEWHQSEVSQ